MSLNSHSRARLSACSAHVRALLSTRDTASLSPYEVVNVVDKHCTGRTEIEFPGSGSSVHLS